MEQIIYEIPKAEIHVHIEGTLEPELMFQIAERNGLLSQLENKSIESIKEKYNFNNLEEFLEIYYTSSSVLIKEEDFSDLVVNYFTIANEQGVIYAEIFFDPQAHLRRGVEFTTILKGLLQGLKLAQNKLNVDGNFIMCFLRDLSEEEAIETFNQFLTIKEEDIIPDLNRVIGIGLDSSEINNPPEKFANLYKLAKEKNFRLCVHCHDEGSIKHIQTAINLLSAERIDHGFDILGDEATLNKCIESQMPFTFCPLSTFKVKRTPDLSVYNLSLLLEKKLLFTINSDDPAFFGGYIGDNYKLVLNHFNLGIKDLTQIAKNSFISTFLNSDTKQKYLNLINEYLAQVFY